MLSLLSSILVGHLLGNMQNDPVPTMPFQQSMNQTKKGSTATTESNKRPHQQQSRFPCKTTTGPWIMIHPPLQLHRFRCALELSENDPVRCFKTPRFENLLTSKTQNPKESCTFSAYPCVFALCVRGNTSSQHSKSSFEQDKSMPMRLLQG